MFSVSHHAISCILHAVLALSPVQCLAPFPGWGRFVGGGQGMGATVKERSQKNLQDQAQKGRIARQISSSGRLQLKFKTLISGSTVSREQQRIKPTPAVVILDKYTGKTLPDENTAGWTVIATLEVVSSTDREPVLTGTTEVNVMKSIANFSNLRISSEGTYNLLFTLATLDSEGVATLKASNLYVEKMRGVRLKVEYPSQPAQGEPAFSVITVYEMESNLAIQKLNWRGLQWKLNVTQTFPGNRHKAKPNSIEVPMGNNSLIFHKVVYEAGLYLPKFEVWTTNNEYRATDLVMVHVAKTLERKVSLRMDNIEFSLKFVLSNGTSPLHAVLLLLNSFIEEFAQLPYLRRAVQGNVSEADNSARVNFTASGKQSQLETLRMMLCRRLKNTTSHQITPGQSFKLLGPILQDGHYLNCHPQGEKLQQYKERMELIFIVLIVSFCLIFVGFVLALVLYARYRHRQQEREHELHRREQELLADIRRREHEQEEQWLDGAAKEEHMAKMHERIQDAKQELEVEAQFNPEMKRLSSHPMDPRSLTGRPSVRMSRLSSIHHARRFTHLRRPSGRHFEVPSDLDVDNVGEEYPEHSVPPGLAPDESDRDDTLRDEEEKKKEDTEDRGEKGGMNDDGGIHVNKNKNKPRASLSSAPAKISRDKKQHHR